MAWACTQRPSVRCLAPAPWLRRFGQSLDCEAEELEGERIEYRQWVARRLGQSYAVPPPEIRTAKPGRHTVVDFARQHEWGLGLVLWEMLFYGLSQDVPDECPPGSTTPPSRIPLPDSYASRRLYVPVVCHDLVEAVWLTPPLWATTGTVSW